MYCALNECDVYLGATNVLSLFSQVKFCYVFFFWCIRGVIWCEFDVLIYIPVARKTFTTNSVFLRCCNAAQQRCDCLILIVLSRNARKLPNSNFQQIFCVALPAVLVICLCSFDSFNQEFCCCLFGVLHVIILESWFVSTFTHNTDKKAQRISYKISVSALFCMKGSNNKLSLFTNK